MRSSSTNLPMSPCPLLRGPRIIHPPVTDRDIACPLHPLDSCRFHRRLNQLHIRRAPWPLMDRNHQAWHHRQQTQTSLCPDILPPQLTHLLRRVSHQVHQFLQLPHSQLHQPPLVLLCQQILRNNPNPCIFHKQDTTPQFQHHHRRIFPHRLCRRFQPLHNQHHLRSTQVSHSQVLTNRTNTFLPLLLYHKPLAVWYRTTFQDRGHCLPNPSRPDNWFRPLPRYLRIKLSLTRSEHFPCHTDTARCRQSLPNAHLRLSSTIRSLFPLDLRVLGLGSIHPRTP